MGTDKALLSVGSSGSRTLLVHAVQTLAVLTPRILLACGANERYRELGLPLVVDRYPDAGPLAGLESALANASEAGDEWLVALACDLPRVRPEVLAELLTHAREHDFDACFFETDLGLEPLCAVYRSTCWPPVRAALDAGERKMVAFLRHSTVRGELPRVGTLRADAFAECLMNVNSPADMTALSAHTERSAHQEVP